MSDGKLTDEMKVMYFECLKAGTKMVAKIARDELGMDGGDRDNQALVLGLGEKVGVSMAIDLNQNRGGGGGQKRSGGGTSGGTADHPCPDCGGKVWDNRESKKGNQPDFKCQKKDDCGWAAWIAGKKKGGGTFNRSLSEIFKLDEDEGLEADFSDEALEDGDENKALPF